MGTEPLAPGSSQHPTPGWLTLDEIAHSLSVDRAVLERLVEARSLRHERSVVLGEVITCIPLSEIYRLEKLLLAARHTVGRSVGEPSEPPSRAGLPPRPLLEEREQKFATLKTLLTARIQELEGQLEAMRAQLAEARGELEVVEGEKLAFVQERKHLVHSVVELVKIRDRLTELAQNTSHDSELRTLREELAVCRTRLVHAEQELAATATLEESYEQAQGELDASRNLVARQAREIEVLRDIERSNQRYIDRLERRSNARES